MKIQVLELPTEYLGDVGHTPYALVLSEVGTDAQAERYSRMTDALKNFDGGPSYVIVTTDAVEL